MEAMADFGAVNLLNYRALTDAIYRVWYGAFDQAAALQLASVLVSLTLALVALEQLMRGRARYHQALARGDAVTPRRLRGPAAWPAAVGPLLLLAAVVVAPVAQLLVWAVSSLGEGASATALARAAVNSLLLASVAAVVAVVAATVVAYGPRAVRRAPPSGRPGERARLRRARHRRRGRRLRAARLARPPDRRRDRRRAAAHRQRGRARVRLRRPLPRARVLRDPVAHGPDRPVARRGARSLGADRSRLLADVHLPLLWPGIATAALLVFVEVMKELPATALLRPLGGDTLAIAVWEATKDSRFDTAALPALLIVAVGLVPVVLAIRLSRGDPPLLADRRLEADRSGVDSPEVAA